VAGEVADGFFVHPLHTPRFLSESTLPAIDRGLAKSGRTRESFSISCQLMVATGDGDEEIERAREAHRSQIAFYGSTPAYRVALECEGWGDLQPELNRMSKRGQWAEMAARIDDSVLERIAVCAPLDRLAEAIRSRCGPFADRVSLIAPTVRDPARFADVVRELQS
jgi:probable F420-dependent oxidoreductase